MNSADPLNLPDAVCVGETMAMIAPTQRCALTDRQAQLSLHVGGAESNVALVLAHFGYRVHWWGRVGDDPFGARILDDLRRGNVVVAEVDVDPERATGVYFKDPGARHSRVFYYRTNSAASYMSPQHGERIAPAARLLHLTGISAALSPSSRELIQALLLNPEKRYQAISFDVNYRPQLWSVAEAAPVLLQLARRADIVLVGRDEAKVLWGTNTADAVRALLQDVPTVVVKDAEVGATEYRGAERTFVPSIPIDVVEPVGAGDAFAAGYLAARLNGDSGAVAVQLGHLLASFTLAHLGDVAAPPPAEGLRAQARSVAEPGGMVRFTDANSERRPARGTVRNSGQS